MMIRTIHTAATARRVLPTVLLLLFLLAGRVAAADLPAPGELAFAAGDYPAAFEALRPLQAERAGDPDYDFLLGRAAYEVGDFETAIFAFERVLIARPDSDRTRLELARCFYAIGDYEASRRYFNAVLGREIPLTVRQNIEGFLARIDQVQRRHQFGGLLAFGLGYDDNVHASPADETIRTALGDVTLTGASATPQSDLVAQTTLLFNHAWRRERPGLLWQTSLLAHNALYRDEDTLDLNLLGLASGPVWHRGNLQTALRGTFNTLLLDAERYLSSFGGELELTWLRDPGTSFGGLLRLASLDYAESARDAMQYALEFRPVLLRGGNRIGFGAGVEYNAASDDAESYLRETLSLRFERPLPWRLTGAAGYRFQNTAYREAAPLFGRKRHDRLHELTAGLTRPLWQAGPNRQLLAQLDYSYTRSDSNLELHEYDKNLTTLSVSWIF